MKTTVCKKVKCKVLYGLNFPVFTQNTEKYGQKTLYLAKNTVFSPLLQIGLLYKFFLLYFKAT